MNLICEFFGVFCGHAKKNTVRSIELLRNKKHTEQKKIALAKDPSFDDIPASACMRDGPTS